MEKEQEPERPEKGEERKGSNFLFFLFFTVLDNLGKNWVWELDCPTTRKSLWRRFEGEWLSFWVPWKDGGEEREGRNSTRREKESRTLNRIRYPGREISGQWNSKFVREVGKKDLKLWEKDWLRRGGKKKRDLKEWRFGFCFVEKEKEKEKTEFSFENQIRILFRDNPFDLNCFSRAGIRLYN